MQILQLHKLTFFICFFCVNFLFAQFNIPDIPREQTSVYDYVNLLSGTQKSSLEQKLITYSDTTSTQIVVAIIGSTNGENIGLLSARWAHKWGVGQKQEDNGIFILLAEQDRKIWISPGYGVEDRLTAGIVGQITRNVIIPEFKKGDYYQGLNKGVDTIFEVLNGAYQGTRQPEPQGFPIGVMFLLFIVFIIIIASISRNNRNNNGRGGKQNGFDIWDAIILSNMGRGSSSSSGWGGSSGGGFSGGGGFGGGFGGGGFSGGGAGGSW